MLVMQHLFGVWAAMFISLNSFMCLTSFMTRISSWGGTQLICNVNL